MHPLMTRLSCQAALLEAKGSFVDVLWVARIWQSVCNRGAVEQKDGNTSWDHMKTTEHHQHLKTPTDPRISSLNHDSAKPKLDFENQYATLYQMLSPSLPAQSKFADAELPLRSLSVPDLAPLAPGKSQQFVRTANQRLGTRCPG